MIMLRVGGLLIGRQAGGAAGWDQGQVTEHRTANGNPLFLFASFATSTLCVCMCKTCPSYLSMLNCASNKTNSWKGLVSYCYFGKKKCIGNFWNMPIVTDCIFSFFYYGSDSSTVHVDEYHGWPEGRPRLPGWIGLSGFEGEEKLCDAPDHRPTSTWPPLVQPCNAITVWPQGSVPQYLRVLNIHNRNLTKFEQLAVL